MGHDFLDVVVAHSRSSMGWGDHNLENRYYKIDGEQVKEGVIGCSWDVVFVIVKGDITELMGEVDLCESPCASAYWHERWQQAVRGRGGQGRGICEKDRRIMVIGLSDCEPLESKWWTISWKSLPVRLEASGVLWKRSYILWRYLSSFNDTNSITFLMIQIDLNPIA